MVAKLMKILENFGAILIVAAFLLWSGDWWKLSNKLFVFAIALLTHCPIDTSHYLENMV